MNPPEKKKFTLGMYGDTDLHQAEGLLYSDKPLSSKMIADLMHVEATVLETNHIDHGPVRNRYAHSLAYYLLLFLVSVSVALSIGLFFSYAHGLGPFAPGSEFSFG